MFLTKSLSLCAVGSIRTSSPGAHSVTACVLCDQSSMRLCKNTVCWERGRRRRACVPCALCLWWGPVDGPAETRNLSASFPLPSWVGDSNLSFALCSRCGRPEGCRTPVYRGVRPGRVDAARTWLSRRRAFSQRARLTPLTPERGLNQTACAAVAVGTNGAAHAVSGRRRG